MRRRELISILGGAVAWPPAAREQQQPLPVIGYLSAQPTELEERRRAFRQGLKDNGFAEGENVVIDYRFGGIRRGSTCPRLQTQEFDRAQLRTDRILIKRRGVLPPSSSAQRRSPQDQEAWRHRREPRNSKPCN